MIYRSINKFLRPHRFIVPFCEKVNSKCSIDTLFLKDNEDPFYTGKSLHPRKKPLFLLTPDAVSAKYIPQKNRVFIISPSLPHMGSLSTVPGSTPVIPSC